MIECKKCKIEGCRMYCHGTKFKYYVYGRRARALADVFKARVNSNEMRLEDFERLFKNAEKHAGFRREAPEILFSDLLAVSKLFCLM